MKGEEHRGAKTISKKFSKAEGLTQDDFRAYYTATEIKRQHCTGVRKDKWITGIEQRTQK